MVDGPCPRVVAPDEQEDVSHGAGGHGGSAGAHSALRTAAVPKLLALPPQLPQVKVPQLPVSGR